MAIVRHITRPENLDSILADGYIKTELCNIGWQTTKGIERDRIKAHGGPLVWFTEEAFATNSQKPGVKHTAFLFDTETTPGLYSWNIIRQVAMNKSKKYEAAILNMEMAAKICGDNPSRWWIAKKAVSLEHCINLDNLEVCVGRTDITATDIVKNAIRLRKEASEQSPYMAKLYANHQFNPQQMLHDTVRMGFPAGGGLTELKNGGYGIIPS